MGLPAVGGGNRNNYFFVVIVSAILSFYVYLQSKT